MNRRKIDAEGRRKKEGKEGKREGNKGGRRRDREEERKYQGPTGLDLAQFLIESEN